jgi:stress response protein YsnF
MRTPEPSPLPLEGVPTFAHDGWNIRLPVRAEQITLAKEVVVRDRVLIHRRQINQVARVQAVLRHEQLRAIPHGDVDVSENISESGPDAKDHDA